MNKNWIICSIFLICNPLLEARNPRRPASNNTPSITICASDQECAQSWFSIKIRKAVRRKNNYKLTSQFLRINPLKKGFDSEIFEKYYLPQNTNLEYRNKQGSVNTQLLEQLAQEVVEEVKVGQKTFHNFTILKCKDFNFKTLSGLLVLKYKDYPFVIKISIEHPHTMAQPYSKSFEANCIFMIGGNFRHLSNFTRIPNLENIKDIIRFNPYYLDTIDFPRKWYWKPQNNYDLQITWNQTPYRKEETIIIPSVYATISDHIDIDDSVSQKELNKIAMKVASDTEFLIDPHVGNFVADKQSKKYTMLDTENFRIMTGLDHTMAAKTYVGWYIEMMSSSLKKYCGRTKKERIQQSFYI